jgi:hypothetical protein
VEIKDMNEIEEVDGIWFPSKVAAQYRRLIASNEWRVLNEEIERQKVQVESACRESQRIWDNLRESGLCIDEVHVHPLFTEARIHEHRVKQTWGSVSNERSAIVIKFLKCSVPAPCFIPN